MLFFEISGRTHRSRPVNRTRATHAQNGTGVFRAGPGRWRLSVGFWRTAAKWPVGVRAGRNETANTGVARTSRVRGVRARVCFRGGKIAAIKSGAETRARRMWRRRGTRTDGEWVWGEAIDRGPRVNFGLKFEEKNWTTSKSFCTRKRNKIF